MILCTIHTDVIATICFKYNSDKFLVFCGLSNGYLTPCVSVPYFYGFVYERVNSPLARSQNIILYHYLSLWRHAKVTALNRAKILLVGLGVGGILVAQVGRSRLDLRIENHLPDLLGWNRLAALLERLVVGVEFLEPHAVDVRQTGALVRAHEGPVLVGF